MKCKVLIISKTRMYGGKVCVGGITREKRYLRLLDSNGDYRNTDTKLDIGDVWNMEYTEMQNTTPPHVEDVIVIEEEFWANLVKGETTITEVLTNKLKVKIWEGSPENLFDGLLKWTKGGTGYINKSGEIPTNSVGFWKSDKNIFMAKKTWEGKETIRYHYPCDGDDRSLKYVGFENPVKTLPAGTIIRVSMPKWWLHEGELRCYLQLSGWYDYFEPKEDNVDDLPY